VNAITALRQTTLPAPAAELVRQSRAAGKAAHLRAWTRLLHRLARALAAISQVVDAQLRRPGEVTGRAVPQRAVGTQAARPQATLTVGTPPVGAPLLRHGHVVRVTSTCRPGSNTAELAVRGLASPVRAAVRRQASRVGAGCAAVAVADHGWPDAGGWAATAPQHRTCRSTPTGAAPASLCGRQAARARRRHVGARCWSHGQARARV